MAVSYELVFAALLLVYLGASWWARLDPRWPVVGSIGLIGGSALATVLGNTTLANTLAPYALLLLGGGVVLLLVTPERAGSVGTQPAGTTADPPEGADERDRPAQDPLHDLQEHPVPVVDRAADHDDQHEEAGDRQPEERKGP